MAALSGLHQVRARGQGVSCPLCHGEFSRFMSFGGRRGAMCPRCRSLERHRYLWLYVERQTSLLREPAAVLHVAPERVLEQRLRALQHLRYRSGDLLRPEADIRLDVTNIDLPDETFDVLLCSHVLEHVDDDRAAMRELLRIVKHGGWAILDAPVDPRLDDTYEDWAITSTSGRRKAFGQWDHVRVYGRNFSDLLREAGWHVDEDPLRLTSQERIEYGIGNEDLRICHRPEASEATAASGED